MTKIKSREHLLNTLAEAAELEHNLLCIYLYAAFSLKETVDENINNSELKTILSWKNIIKEVAIQEMGHLALVSNIIVAIGGKAHFNRPNFPVSPGYYPNKFIINLRPFDLKTLEHFLFLERPTKEGHLKDPIAEINPTKAPSRETPDDRLMTYIGNYKTVGEIYESIKEGLEYLSVAIGEDKLFCGTSSNQLSEAETKMKKLHYITNLEDAKNAIKHIVEEGEGGECDDCHFSKFSNILIEYNELLKINPDFSPARNVIENPVMRRNSENNETKWINHPKSIELLDCSNSLYNLMLRFLSQLYALEERTIEDKKLMINATFVIMKCMGQLSTELTKTPVSQNEKQFCSGMTFTLDRYVNAIEIRNEKFLLSERLHEIIEKIDSTKEHHQISKQLKEIYKKLITT